MASVQSHKRHDWYERRQTHGQGGDWCRSTQRDGAGGCAECGTPLVDVDCVHCSHLSETCHHGQPCPRGCPSQERSGVEV